MSTESDALARVTALANHYESLAAQMPTPHGPVTEAFSIAARDIRSALGNESRDA